MIENKVLLIVMDGVGLNKKYPGNAFYLAKTPVLDNLLKNYPHTSLGASEKYVGLPKNQFGSSEVGHSTIGAGRIIPSDLLRINKSIKNKTFYKNKILNNALLKLGNNKLHLIGLLSDGGVHSNIKHLFALLDVVKKHKLKNVFLHLFSDGRDVYNKSLTKYIIKLQRKLKSLNVGQIGSISGRFYAMDRDNRWGRQKKVYDLLVFGKGNYEKDIFKFIKVSYSKNVTDEFLEPTMFNKDSLIEKGDTVIFFNFRGDRSRQFTKMLVDKKFNKFKTKDLKLNFLSFTEYDSSLKNVKVIFPPIKPKPGLGQIISRLGYKQLRIAETEKFAHVTYFFNQGQEFPNKLEDRILVNSPKVKTYDLKPEMSAKEITRRLISTLNKDYKFTLLNFANGDMVGHTGNIKAAIKALETIDACIGKIIKKLNLDNTTLIITADHGNCDKMINDDGSINTSHSINKVPFILISNKKYNLKKVRQQGLANIAPTILKILKLNVPKYMLEDLLKDKI